MTRLTEMCGCLFIEKERLRPGSGENLTVRQWDFHIYSLAVRKKKQVNVGMVMSFHYVTPEVLVNINQSLKKKE